ncbi:related to DNA replication complex GINS protein SLD5 [Saccharomycodes ludwigii]|uniref:DNA replication complex GINS protein SLD5 n=1 Tax=Saccharomycodes ludwigii TaxID=36035 RepID=A0A376BB05_9ASCO|nr:hypothetical protein SCDLUD_002582 [Saccharomycodes ludwigii]KAH3901104.1 hypothetical protein SCDLUD_002582 [Saccharomycodes ludwigii]SSD61858.1 related to DNA replication complex GINS protein SLD5 [Saccharomycodes ludwigii]
MDIDDILADLDDTTNIPTSSSFNTSVFSINNNNNDSSITEENSILTEDDTLIGHHNNNTHKTDNNTTITFHPEKDYQELITTWRNERMAPEILHYPDNLIKRILYYVEQQIEYIEYLSLGFDNDSTSTDNNANRNVNTMYKDKKLSLLCMEAELERVKFVIRSYIRCRLSKIDRFAIYLHQLINLDDIGNDELSKSGLVSRTEYMYLVKHSELLLNHLHNTVLKHMHENLQAIDDNNGSIDMVTKPQLDNFVFIFVRGRNQNTNDNNNKKDKKETYVVHIDDEEIDLVTGGIYIIRYNVIKKYLEEGLVVLL